MSEPYGPRTLCTRLLCRPFERLVRKLLRLPHHPAVVLLDTIQLLNVRWAVRMRDTAPARLAPQAPRTASASHAPVDQVDLYLRNCEAELFEVATYYGLPLLSFKAAAFGRVQNGEAGFWVCGWSIYARCREVVGQTSTYLGPMPVNAS
eukprot:4246-Chlamydomonas_euryale.AAC.1